MEVEFEEAVRIKPPSVIYKNISKRGIRRLVIISVFILVFCAVYELLLYSPKLVNILWIILGSICIVVVPSFFFIWYFSKRKYFFLKYITSIQKIKVSFGEMLISTFHIKNLRVIYVPPTFEPKKVSMISFISGDIVSGISDYYVFKSIRESYGPGKCYSFSTLFHSIPKSYAKFSTLPVEKKLKDGRIKNPRIEKIIKKLKPRWLDPKKDLIRSFDLYSFQSNGKTYYALEIVFDEDLVKSKPKEVYDFYVKVVKEMEKGS